MKTTKPQNTFLALGACLLIVFGLEACQEAPKLTKVPSITPIFISTPTKVPSITPIFISTRTKESALPLRADELKRRWLSGVPCHPPCWEEIVPGETSAIKAAEILSANPMFTKVEVDKSSSAFDNEGFVSYEWYVLFDYDVLSGDALFDSNTPDQIIYAIRPTIPATRLDELIQAYGEPSHIWANEIPPADIGGPFSWEVNIVWLSQGFSVETSDFSRADKILINGDLIFNRTLYFPSTLEGYQRASNLYSLDHLKPWRGYSSFYSYSTPVPTCQPFCPK